MKRTAALLAGLLGSSAVLAIPLRAQAPQSPDPAKGYTAEQAERLHRMFDLADWQVTKNEDYARYTLLRLPEFVRHAVIPRSGPIAPLASAPDPGVGKVVAEAGEMGKLALDAFLSRSESDGFIVVHHGKIVFEQYPRMRPADKHLLWSISKTFASLLVGQLEVEGKVQVDKPIETYIPELASTAWRGTPVIDILDMASGMDALENDESNTWERPELRVFQYESSLGLLKRTPATDRSTYEIVASIPRLIPSGQKYSYMSVNTFVLAWLVEKVTGMPYGDAIANRIWSRMGAESDAMLVVAPNTGAPAGHGGISTTLRDLARYGLLFTPSWKTVAATPVVPQEFITKVQKDGRPSLLVAAVPGSKDGVGVHGEPARHETRQWDAVWPDGDFYKGGFRGQGLYVSPSRDLVVGFFSSDGDSKSYARAIARSGLFDQ